jgi:hypothetical protein
VNVGRLVEVRADQGYRTADEVDAIFAQIARESSKVPAGKRLVVVTDWRRCPIMSDAASERMLSLLTRGNGLVERSAALVDSASPLAELQFMRLIRESKHPERRLFHSPAEVTQWLGACLSDAEAARLRAFLEEPLTAAAGSLRAAASETP